MLLQPNEWRPRYDAHVARAEELTDLDDTF